MSSTGQTSDLLDELQRLRDEIEALRDEVQHAMRRMLSAEDRRALKWLLPLIHELQGARTWSAVSLLADARAADAGELLDALGEWITAGSGMRSFGRFLARASGVAIDGRRLVAAGGDRDGWLYLVVCLSGAEKGTSAVTRGPVSVTLTMPINQPLRESFE